MTETHKSTANPLLNDDCHRQGSDLENRLTPTDTEFKAGLLSGDSTNPFKRGFNVQQKVFQAENADMSAPFLLRCIEPLRIEIPNDQIDNRSIFNPFEKDANEFTVVSPIRKTSRPDLRAVFDLHEFAGSNATDTNDNSPDKENQLLKDSEYLRFDVKSLSEHYETSEPLKWDFSADSFGSNKFSSSTDKRVSEEYFSGKLPDSPTHTRYENPDDAKLNKLEKKLKSLKKRQSRVERDFIISHGYGPSESDRLQNEELRKVTVELNRLKREIKAVKTLETDSVKIRAKLTGGNSPSFSHYKLNRANFTLEQMCQLAWKVIEEQRGLTDRPEQLEEMNLAQLRQEKLSVQRVLLHLEGAHGRPVEPNDRELVRPLYDWYRKVKRFLKLSGSPRGSLCELQTIPEELHLDEFHVHTDEKTITQGLKSSQSALVLATRKRFEANAIADSFATETQDEIGDFYSSLHKLEPEQLYKIHRLLADRKSSLRKLLSSDEIGKLSEDVKFSRKYFQSNTNSSSQLYHDYKKIKAKLKLVDALLSKQRASC